MHITSFQKRQVGAATAALAAFQAGVDGSLGTGKKMTGVRTETFEGYRAWNGSSGASDPSRTNVGAFSSLGGWGLGSSTVNGGSRLQVRDDSPWIWGRHNTSGFDGNWLDSNDTYGVKWRVEGAGKFNALAFLLTDVADVGAKFTIKVGGQKFANVIGTDKRLANGSIHLVRVLLPRTVRGLTVELRNNRLNDGFGIDGATVAKVAPVPLPPAALLLLSGCAGLAALCGRARRAA